MSQDVPEITHKHYATYLHMALLMGVCSNEDAVRWADMLLFDIDEPEEWMLQLSMAGNRDQVDIIRILEGVPGEDDEHLSFRLLAARLAKKIPFISKKDTVRLRDLHQFTFWDIEEEAKALVYQLCSDLALVGSKADQESGVQKDLDALIRLGGGLEPYV